jgi:hypothetical protein
LPRRRDEFGLVGRLGGCGGSADIVCKEETFVLTSSPSRQAMTYNPRGSVFVDSMSGGRKRNRATLISDPSARIETRGSIVAEDGRGGSQNEL